MKDEYQNKLGAQIDQKTSKLSLTQQWLESSHYTLDRKWRWCWIAWPRKPRFWSAADLSCGTRRSNSRTVKCWSHKLWSRHWRKERTDGKEDEYRGCQRKIPASQTLHSHLFAHLVMIKVAPNCSLRILEICSAVNSRDILVVEDGWLVSKQNYKRSFVKSKENNWGREEWKWFSRWTSS